MAGCLAYQTQLNPFLQQLRSSIAAAAELVHHKLFRGGNKKNNHVDFSALLNTLYKYGSTVVGSTYSTNQAKSMRRIHIIALSSVTRRSLACRPTSYSLNTLQKT